jgi:hypothetical protein
MNQAKEQDQRDPIAVEQAKQAQAMFEQDQKEAKPEPPKPEPKQQPKSEAS